VGSDNKKAPAKRRSSVVVSGDASVLIGYQEWLDRQALSSASRRAYLARCSGPCQEPQSSIY
jgi:hypothetical protein